MRGRDRDVGLADVTPLLQVHHIFVHGRLHRRHLQAVERRLSFVQIGALTDGIDDQTVDVHAEQEREVAVVNGGRTIVQENRSNVGALRAQHVELGEGQGIHLRRGVDQAWDLGNVEALVPDGALGIDGRVEAGDEVGDVLHVVAGVTVGQNAEISHDVQEAADIVGQLLDRIENESAIVEAGGGLDGDAFDRRLNEYMLKKVVKSRLSS